MPARETFGRERRVRRHADYLRIQSQSLRVSSRHFYFLIAPTSPEAPARPAAESATAAAAAAARLGLIVTRKMGGAVVRNRIKRVCRACFRHVDWIPSGIDLIVIARTGVEQLGMRDALAEWESVRPLIRKRASQALAKVPNKGHLSASGR